MADDPKSAKVTPEQWKLIGKAFVVFIISVLGALGYDFAKKVDEPQPSVQVNVDTKPVAAPVATPTATPDHPSVRVPDLPPMPQLTPVATPTGTPVVAPPIEPTADAISLPQWIPTDSDGKRIVSPGLEMVAALPDGDYGVMQIPAEGATFVRRTVSIRTSGVPPPVVVVPVQPLPVDPLTPTPPPVDPSTKATAATYVYEKDDGGVPSGVLAGLNRLNREKKILATIFEDDTTDGDGDVPDQYKAAVDAARATDGPDLIVLAGATVLRVVKSPTTAEQVWGAVP